MAWNTVDNACALYNDYCIAEKATHTWNYYLKNDKPKRIHMELYIESYPNVNLRYGDFRYRTERFYK